MFLCHLPFLNRNQVLLFFHVQPGFRLLDMDSIWVSGYAVCPFELPPGFFRTTLYIF